MREGKRNFTNKVLRDEREGGKGKKGKGITSTFYKAVPPWLRPHGPALLESDEGGLKKERK
jgi:hypothetical protein